jgi:DNA-binding beta-propeller fold protein YncE
MNRLLVLFSASALALSALGSPMIAAAAPGPSGLRVVSRIAGPDGGWDYASFDAARGRVYVAHSNTVLKIDAATGKLDADFAAGDHLHAVVPVPGANVIVTTNSGDNSAKILSATDGKLLASIATAKDADGAIYDPASGLVLVICGDAGAVTLIDPKARKSVGTIDVGDKLEFGAVDGKGRFYVNVEDKNEIAVVDLHARKVITHYPLTGCTRPTGLAYVSGGRLVAACGSGAVEIMDASSGRDIATFKIGGFPDAVLYDPVRHLALVPSALTGTLAVIALDGKDNNTIIDTVPTQLGARTGAVDPKTGRVWLPTAQYILPVPAGQRPSTKPGTFEVLVLDRH